jgi:thioredoxin-like negative regulator of GroEL
MAERTEAELVGRANAGESFAVFLYTPLCGTCKVASRMLEVVMAMRPSYEVDRANIHFTPQLAQEWRVESVPCLVAFEGREARKLYAFQSVETVDRFLKPLFPDSGGADTVGRSE